ncbi:MAG TPA: hypothetical protein VGL06_07675 [Pseudonocardiaceae bacterium]
MNATEFADRYLGVWTVDDDGERSALVAKLFTADAVHHISPGDASFVGRDQIDANIAQVHKDISAAGLQFRVGKAVPNGNSFLLPREMLNPAGKAVKSGRDFFLLDDEGRISALYMFHDA